MRHILLTAAIGATLLSAVPALADSVTIHAGDNGVAVRAGGGYHHRTYRHHDYYSTGWRRHYAGCRTVRVRTILPSGNVVVKTRRTCG